MAQLAQLLFSVGVILVAVTFAAYVGHAVMLANGRRTLPRLATAPQPAFAGVVTGSSATPQGTCPPRLSTQRRPPGPHLARCRAGERRTHRLLHGGDGARYRARRGLDVHLLLNRHHGIAPHDHDALAASTPKRKL